MGNLFISEEGLVQPFIITTDSTLKANRGKVWHKSSMEKGTAPPSGVNTDAEWGFSHTKGWTFAYKLYMVCSTGSSSSVIVSLSADVTIPNIQDNQIDDAFTSILSSATLKKVHYMVADPGYDDHDLYDLRC